MKRMKPMREVAASAAEVEEVEGTDDVQGQDEDQADALEEKPDDVTPIEKKPVRRAPRDVVPRESKVITEMRTNEDRNLKDWLEEIAPGGAIRVKVTRTSPKVWKGMNVGGVLQTYNQQVDEEFIRDHHGGGDFYLIVQKPRKTGAGWEYAGGRVIQIAGDPRTDDVYRDKGPETAPAAAGPANVLVDRVVGSLERQLEREQARHQDREPRGHDAETMKMMMQPMQAQIGELSRMLREKDAQLREAGMAKPEPRDEFRDKMLDKLLDGDSARITSLRAQYESELRQVKEGAMQNESRLRDSFERDKQGLAMSHDRELNALRSAYDMRVSSQETSHSTGRTLMDGEIRRLQADLSEAKHELAALRLKKDKTILEQASEFAAIKDAMSEIAGDDKGEKSGWEKLAEVAGNLPIVQGMLQNVGGQPQPPAPPPAPPQQPQPQPRLMTGPDGHLYRQNPDGSMKLIRRRAPPKDANGEALPDIPAGTVKLAVDFLESAFRGGQEPDQVATSVRSMIPADVLKAIKDRGADSFLTDVAKIDGNSSLATQAGRNWSRKVGKALLGQ